jgi:SAM-dependent methyltransferase
MTAMPDCPVCGGRDGEVFFELPGVPVYCNVLWPTAGEAVAAPRADIRLALCAACGMIWNTSFDAAATDYGVEYENSLHYSDVFQQHAEELAERLAGYAADAATVIDVGCGKGDFLALLCANGRCRGLGFDPSYDGAQDGVDWLSFVRDEYRVDAGYARAELVVCRHVLEHIPSPRAFVSTLRDAVAAEGVLYVEVPSAEYMLRNRSIWDVIYEHCSYFTAPALASLFRDCGLDVRGVGTSFGDQYLWIEAVPSPVAKGESRSSAEALAELTELAEGFRASFDALLANASGVLGENAGSVALWGAGSKGVTFLNVADPERRIASVFDVNPRKHGRHVPGSGQRVLAPAEVAAAGAETVLVMNPLYADEIAQLVRGAGSTAGVVLV